MQLKIGGLATKICFVHFLQQVVLYFTGRSIHFEILFYDIPTNQKTNSFKRAIHVFTD